VAITPAPAAVDEAAAIARRAAERLTATPGDAAPRVVVAPASADLRDLVALIRRAAAVVTPDTANMHIAAAVGTPYVAVYSAYTAVALWGAWGEGPRVVVQVGDRRPIREIPPERIVAGFDALCENMAARS
ncbi:MAG TPA: glycosyltransferase family 9 protein, partial [Gemmatirosa sp.]